MELSYFPAIWGYLSLEDSHLITCFCLYREKLAVARLQREVAQRTSQGAMVSFGSSPFLSFSCPESSGSKTIQYQQSMWKPNICL